MCSIHFTLLLTANTFVCHRVCVCVCVCKFLMTYPSKRRLLVDSIALSTLRMACSMDELTNVSPSLLTAGTVFTQRQIHLNQAEPG